MHSRNSQRLFGAVTLTVIALACGGPSSSTDATATSTASTQTEISVTTSAATTSPGVESTTSSAAPTTTTTGAETTTATTIAEPTTTTTAAATAQAAPPGSVIVTAEDGVYVVTPGGANQLISYSTPPAVPADLIDFAISDTRGGVIIHPNRSPYVYKGNASIVYRIPLGGSAAQQMLVSASDQGLQLEDVVVQGSSVGVYYTRLEGSLPEDLLQTLRRYDLDSNAVQPVADVAGWESGVWNFSVGGDIIAYQWAGEGWYGFFLRELDGLIFDWPLDPTVGGLFDCYPECPVGIAVGPGGHRLAYAQRSAGTFWVTIIDVESGDTVAYFTLPAGVYEIHSIDLGDEYLVVNRVEEGSEWYISPLLVEISQGSLGVSEIPFNGLARITRVIPQLNGVVAFP